MSTEIKSGKEILDDFFTEIGENKELDEQTTKAIIELHEQDSLSDRNLTNRLEEQRDKKEDDKA